jgi:hypothetical protein
VLVHEESDQGRQAEREREAQDIEQRGSVPTRRAELCRDGHQLTSFTLQSLSV